MKLEYRKGNRRLRALVSKSVDTIAGDVARRQARAELEIRQGAPFPGGMQKG